MIVARNKEISELKEIASVEQAQLVAVYGRRRVGKTFLVREDFEYDFTFYHTGLSGGSYHDQLSHFQVSLSKYGMTPAKAPENWLEAFSMLEDLLARAENPHKNRVVFLDELPWMDTKNSRFITGFEAFWNGWASAQRHLTVIICGSATSWMTNKILRNYGGLHNRVTMRIHLQPFSLKDCEEYASKSGLVINRQQIVECYMIMGGIPYYWSLLSRGMSLDQNVDHLFFSPDGELFDEFSSLYRSLFRNPEPYLKIIQELGKKKRGMSTEEISSASKMQKNGHLSSCLSDLESCGFIREYVPYGKRKKNSLWQLIDNYTLFYYQFLERKKEKDDRYWTNSIGTPVRNTWAGLAFEMLGLQHLSQIKKALGISGIVSAACSWQTRGAQIDLLIDRKDQVVNICEMKYCGDEYIIDSETAAGLRRKRELFMAETGCKKAVHITLVTPYGVKHNSHANEIQSVVTFDDLFDA